MKKRCQEILHQFYTQLDGIVQTELIALEQTQPGIELCHHTLGELRQLLMLYPELSQEDEIYFFKHIKPQPLQHLIYFYEVRNCYLQLPKGAVKRQLDFLKFRLLGISESMSMHRDFLFYMEQQCTFQDQLYFVRKPKVVMPLIPELMFYVDPDFASSHDVLWARLLAKQKEMSFLQQLKRSLKQQQYPTTSSIHIPELHWTASKTALVELIYALYNAHAINDGEEDIAKIAAGFEVLFDVKLENVYKTYAEIKERKGKRARFVRKLWEGFIKKMEEEDGF